MNKLLAVVVLTVAFLTNPGVDDHVIAALKKTLPYAGMLDESGFLNVLVGAQIKREMVYANCLVFSFSYNSEEKGPITIGAFGFVKAL